MSVTIVVKGNQKTISNWFKTIFFMDICLKIRHEKCVLSFLHSFILFYC